MRPLNSGSPALAAHDPHQIEALQVEVLQVFSSSLNMTPLDERLP
jgi:hypothetical protein